MIKKGLGIIVKSALEDYRTRKLESNVLWIVLHCSATEEGVEFDAEDIDRWHKDRGFAQIGYHRVYLIKGGIQDGRPLNKDHIVEPFERGAHAKGINSASVGACYIGGLDSARNPKDTRTAEQLADMEQDVKALLRQFPNARVIGHNQIANKACPCFDVPEWAASVGIPENKIFRGKLKV